MLAENHAARSELKLSVKNSHPFAWNKLGVKFVYKSDSGIMGDKND